MGLTNILYSKWLTRVVQKQSTPECEEDGDVGLLQDRAGPASSAHHQRCYSGAGGQRKFLCVPICQDLSLTINPTSLAKKAQQQLYFQ